MQNSTAEAAMDLLNDLMTWTGASSRRFNALRVRASHGGRACRERR
jgi:hypothetical protein